VEFNDLSMNKISIIKFLDLMGFNLKSKSILTDILNKKGNEFKGSRDFLDKIINEYKFDKKLIFNSLELQNLTPECKAFIESLTPSTNPSIKSNNLLDEVWYNFSETVLNDLNLYFCLGLERTENPYKENKERFFKALKFVFLEFKKEKDNTPPTENELNFISQNAYELIFNNYKLITKSQVREEKKWKIIFLENFKKSFLEALKISSENDYLKLAEVENYIFKFICALVFPIQNKFDNNQIEPIINYISDYHTSDKKIFLSQRVYNLKGFEKVIEVAKKNSVTLLTYLSASKEDDFTSLNFNIVNNLIRNIDFDVNIYHPFKNFLKTNISFPTSTQNFIKDDFLKKIIWPLFIQVYKDGIVHKRELSALKRVGRRFGINLTEEDNLDIKNKFLNNEYKIDDLFNEIKGYPDDKKYLLLFLLFEIAISDGKFSKESEGAFIIDYCTIVFTQKTNDKDLDSNTLQRKIFSYLTLIDCIFNYPKGLKSGKKIIKKIFDVMFLNKGLQNKINYFYLTIGYVFFFKTHNPEKEIGQDVIDFCFHYLIPENYNLDYQIKGDEDNEIEKSEDLSKVYLDNLNTFSYEFKKKIGNLPLRKYEKHIKRQNRDIRKNYEIFSYCIEHPADVIQLPSIFHYLENFLLSLIIHKREESKCNLDIFKKIYSELHFKNLDLGERLLSFDLIFDSLTNDESNPALTQDQISSHVSAVLKILVIPQKEIDLVKLKFRCLNRSLDVLP